ncbi:hypothetical protein ACFOEY_15690 [Paracandidimonas soli]
MGECPAKNVSGSTRRVRYDECDWTAFGQLSPGGYGERCDTAGTGLQ